MFSNKDLRKLLIPLIIEQLLTSLIGTVDTMMVSNLGSAAVSGVALVDSINKLVIFLFTALATGGTIVCSQYIGRRDRNNANSAARQVLLAALALSLVTGVIFYVFRGGLLRLIFGQVEPAVMEAAESYFRVTIFGYPFIALFGACAALFRAAGNSRLPMKVSIFANLINISGNALLMFVFKMGVVGAATATLAANAFSAIVLLVLLRREKKSFQIGSYLSIRPDFHMIWLVLCIGIPSGIENAMFQFGKLMVQSTVSTLGTTAIAANAIVAAIELMTSMPSQAVATGLMTVVGQCMGAGKVDEAKYYIKKLTVWSFVILFSFNWLAMAVTPLATQLAGMDAESAKMTVDTLLVISIIKPICWMGAFVPASGMRAAGDVKFGMVVSSCTMWIFRVGLSTLLCRVLGWGLLGIWSGYFADWVARSIIFGLRYRSGKWVHKVIKD